ncbi:hypothetical protein FA13DRAFT_1726556 [Coprinellus micaceus]|uniref:DUF6533 domain-containing protein n=1 Tax=Coprinellus micaceus TaxID=71717 RepID=A0A4Y7TV80_COPMI|nr:hypothetical protein FA13DRAFT_1726556 [Coprinellus micaceus]
MPMCHGDPNVFDRERFNGHDLVVVGCIAYSALTLSIWEWLINIEFEVEFLTSSSSRLMKLVYGTSRYLGIIIQLLNTRFVATMRNVYCPPPDMCSRWFALQLSVTFVLMFNFEGLLMAHVYALYDKSFAVGSFLSVAMVTKVISIGVLAVLIAKDVIFETVSCVVQMLPPTALAVCALELAGAVMIVGLTLYRYSTTMVQNRGRPIPLLKLVLRDGLVSFALISGLYLAIVIDTKTTGEVCRIILPLTNAIASISTTRIIRNLRKFPVPNERMGEVDDLQLTSVMMTRSSESELP